MGSCSRFLLALTFGCCAAAAAPAARPTAVYTLDHVHGELTAENARGLRGALTAWARECRIVEGGAIYRLECPAAPDAGEDGVEAMPATVALFRDLDETVYLAGCPVLDEERVRRRERESAKPEERRRPDPELEADLADCREIETARTFSVEVEADEMRAVVRGRALRLTVFETQPKPRTTSTPYSPPATKGSLGRAGPPTTSTVAPNEAEEPNWRPPDEPPSRAQPRAAAPSLRDPGVARTTLRAGRLRVKCAQGEAQVWIDGAYMGQAPIDTPLPAGRHTVVAKRGEAELEAKIELEAGQRLEVDPCKSSDFNQAINRIASPFGSAPYDNAGNVTRQPTGGRR